MIDHSEMWIRSMCNLSTTNNFQKILRIVKCNIFQKLRVITIRQFEISYYFIKYILLAIIHSRILTFNIFSLGFTKVRQPLLVSRLPLSHIIFDMKAMILSNGDIRVFHPEPHSVRSADFVHIH